MLTILTLINTLLLVLVLIQITALVKVLSGDEEDVELDQE